MAVKTKKEVKHKKIAKVIPIFLIILIFLTTFISAFSFSIFNPKDKVNVGENTTFTATLDIESGERIPIEYFDFRLTGPLTFNCRFDHNGSIISGCGNMSVDLISNSNISEGNMTGNNSGTSYNFGFGYGYGGPFAENLSFNVSLNSSHFPLGNYQPSIKGKIKSLFFTSFGENITFLKPVNITSLHNSSLCITSSHNLTLSSFITGSIMKVYLGVNTNGTWSNITFPGTSEGTYFHTITNQETLNGTTIFWQWIVKDIGGNLTTLPVENKYINAITTLTINPPTPDGNLPWYISEPLFTLTNPDASFLFYRWDSTANNAYIGSFGLDGIPNAPPKLSAGIQDINYWSDVCILEKEQRNIYKIDLVDPIINNLYPSNGSNIVNNLRPNISAYLDEIYQSNSGINLSLIFMFINKVSVPINITPKNLDASIIHYPQADLPLGQNNVTINVTDKAGRNSQLTWPFNLSVTPVIDLIVHAPTNMIYNTRRVPFNLTTSIKADIIEYNNSNDKKQLFRRLCRNCDDYGFFRKKTKSLNEGPNNISFRAIGSFDEENVYLLVESKDPKIRKTEPRRGFTNGTFFVEFDEMNPTSLFLNFWNETESGFREVNITYECFLDSKYKCELLADLTGFNNQEISFSFNISDIIGNIDISRKRTLDVDTSPPLINSINHSINGRKVEFIFNITELNFDKILYKDSFDINPRFRNFCTRINEDICSVKKSFRSGNHSIDILSLDEAGNSDLTQLNFTIL